MERFLEYWQAAWQQQLLHAVTPEQIKASWQHISGSQIKSGQLSGIAPGLYGVIPVYATLHDQYFFPYILLVSINEQGECLAAPQLSLPIIPRINLEPSYLQPICLGQSEDFTNYLAINPPQWLDEPELLTWTQQLNYAQLLLDEVNHKWRTELSQVGFVLQEDCLIFSVSALHPELQLSNLDQTLLEQENKITLIDADIFADTAQHARNIVINEWVNAALKQTEPPRIVWIAPNKAIQYANIFSCFAVSAEPHTMEDMFPKLQQEYDNYSQGKHVLNNWHEITKRLQNKYFDKGGIAARLNQLQASAKDAKIQTRHMQVLHSIWLRQIEQLSQWSKLFDFVPGMQKQRLQRLHAFFKQNFQKENVAGFTQKQFEELLLEKLRRAENSERMINDALHQVENDLYQETLIRDKCLQWCASQQIQTQDVSAIQEILEGKIWPALAKVAIMYWQQEFAAKCGFAGFLDAKPTVIDQLIVENAQYIDPIKAAQLLSISKRAIIMGNYNPICNPRFPVQIDFELTKYYGLAENDADFEDLQFDGVLLSVGNMWSMVAKDREADQILSGDAADLQYEMLDVQTSSVGYHGSLVNQGTVSAVVDWLQKNSPHRDEITIYTCFGGQALTLQEVLSTTFYTSVPIRLIQDPCFVKSKYSIFVPVYCADDPGPYIFDSGTEMFDQLLANTEQKLIVIGDRRIFKPSLHSATGKFARLFNLDESAEQAIIIQEAECV